MSLNEKVSALIQRFELEPHIEGGFYKRTYESPEQINTPNGERHAMTSIYFLLAGEAISKWHRLSSFERWLFHEGSSVIIHTLDAEQGLRSQYLGVEAPATPIVDIPPDTWFAAEMADTTGYALMSCVVCPGFDFADFELADRDQLSLEYPEARPEIVRLT